MPDIYLDRDTIDSFHADAGSQQIKLQNEDLNRQPPPQAPLPIPIQPVVAPPPPPPVAEVAPVVPLPPAPTFDLPDLATFQAQAGLGASTPPPAPSSSGGNDFGLGSLQDFQRKAGLLADDVGAAVGGAKDAVGGAINSGLGSLRDFQNRAGILTPDTAPTSSDTLTNPMAHQPAPEGGGTGDWQSLAQAQLGKPYEWGSAGGRSNFGADATGFDCSGFVSYIYKDAFGVDLPAQTSSAYAATKHLDQKDAQPGDIVLYNMDDPDPHIQHIAIYLGDGKVIQSGGSTSTRYVNVAPIGTAGDYEFRRANGLDSSKLNAAAVQHVGSAAVLGTDDGKRAPAASGVPADVAAVVPDPTNRDTFVQTTTPLAKAWEAKTGIPAAYFLAVNGSESNWGKAQGNELFGIKAPGNAGSTNQATWEQEGGQRVDQDAGFGAYKTANDAYAAFVDLISSTPRYAGAWSQFQKDKDPDALFQGLNTAGYATDPHWASNVSSIARSLGQPGGGDSATSGRSTTLSNPISPVELNPTAPDPRVAIDADTDRRAALLRTSVDQMAAQNGKAAPVMSAEGQSAASVPPTDSNPLQRYGSQLSDAIMGMIRHATGQNDSATPAASTGPLDAIGNPISTDVSNVPTGSQPTPSDSLTNPTRATSTTTPAAGTLGAPGPQPTVFDQAGQAIAENQANTMQNPIGQAWRNSGAAALKSEFAPSILDPGHSANVSHMLIQKYGTTEPSDAMTPEDRAAAENMQMVVGGAEMGGEGKLVDAAGNAVKSLGEQAANMAGRTLEGTGLGAKLTGLGRDIPSGASADIPSPHGLAVPDPGYSPGTPEHQTEQLLRQRAVEQGTRAPDFNQADIRSLPGMSGSYLNNLSEVRDAVTAGLPSARWYEEMVGQIKKDTGETINPREAQVLMGAFGGNAGVKANYHTMLSMFDAMRQARPDLTGFENMDIPQVQASPEFERVRALMAADKVYASPDQIAAVMRGYKTGEVPIPSGPKLASYTQSFLGAQDEAYNPFTAQDVWQGRLYGSRVQPGPTVKKGVTLLDKTGAPKMSGQLVGPDVAASDPTFRSMHTLNNWVAREMDIKPREAQAAGWVVMRTLWNDPAIGPALRTGEKSLAQALKEGKAAGILDDLGSEGNLAEVLGKGAKVDEWDNKIQTVRDRIRANGSFDLAAPESATALDTMQLRYAGKGMRVGVNDLKQPVDTAAAQLRRDSATAQGPAIRVPGPVELDENGRIPWLQQQHSVQQVGPDTYVNVTGIGDPAAEAIGARLGATHYNHASPELPTVGGFIIEPGQGFFTPQDLGALTRALRSRGVAAIPSETGSFVRVPAMDDALVSLHGIIKVATDEAGIGESRLSTYQGVTHDLTTTRPAGGGAAAPGGATGGGGSPDLPTAADNADSAVGGAAVGADAGPAGLSGRPPRAGVTAGATAADATPPVGSTWFHGTAKPYSSVESGQRAFEEGGNSLGPGHYMAKEPGVASTYAERAQEFNPDETPGLIAQGGNVRKAEMPPDMRLFDLTNNSQDLEPDEITRIATALDRSGQNSSRYAADELRYMAESADPAAELGGDASPSAVFQAMRDRGMTPYEINRTLQKLGYEGIEHEDVLDGAHAVVVFPESVGRLRNAVSGRQGGSIGVQPMLNMAGAVGGGAAGNASTPEDASPAERAVRIAGGAGAGVLAVHAGTSLIPKPAGVAGREFDLHKIADMIAQQKATQPGLLTAPGKVGKIDRLLGYTSANMLSGIGTQVQNLLGNTGQTLARPAFTFAGGHQQDAIRDVLAMGGALSNAFAAFGTTLKTGQRVAGKYEAPVLTGIAAPLSAPLRMLGATDAFFRTLNSAGGAAAEASRFMRENPTLTMDEVLSRHGKQIVDAAADASSRAVLEGGGGAVASLGNKLASWRVELLHSGDHAQEAVGLALQWFVPMSRVPGVVLGEGIRALPGVNEVTGISRAIGAARRGDHYAAQQELGRTALQSFTNFAVLSEVAQGNITGDGPTSASEKARLMEAVDADGNFTWRPNSIRVGGKWIDYSGLGPIALPMSSIANGTETLKDYTQQPPDQRPKDLIGTVETVGTELVKREAMTISNAWFLRGIGDILNAVKSGNLKGISTNILAVGDRLVPAESLLNEFSKLSNATTPEPTNPLEREMGRLPGLNRMVPPRISVTTGRPVQTPKDIFSTIVRGTPSGSANPNPVALEISRLNEVGHSVGVSAQDNQYKGALQTPEQTRTLQETMGKATNQYVLNVMANPAYQALSDAQKAQALKQAVTQAASAADIDLDGNVARDPHNSALLQWHQTPQYQGVKGTPQEVARQNFQITEAKNKLSEYTARWGTKGEMRLRLDDPAAYKLSQRDAIDSDRLKRLKDALDKATGGALNQTGQTAAAGGLVGAGSTVLP